MAGDLQWTNRDDHQKPVMLSTYNARLILQFITELLNDLVLLAIAQYSAQWKRVQLRVDHLLSLRSRREFISLGLLEDRVTIKCFDQTLSIDYRTELSRLAIGVCRSGKHA